jgi:nucleotide-binding universal stress UspA family protein
MSHTLVLVSDDVAMRDTSPRGRIVVGVDRSENATHALAWALGEAAVRGAVLEVVHGWAPPVAMSDIGALAYPVDPGVYAAGARELLDTALADIEGEAAARGVTVEPHSLQGNPSSVLLERLEEADLLVVGSRGHGGFVGLLLGSVTNQCIHHATGPVVVVPPSAPLPGTGEVVVGVDGSEAAWAALRWAIEEAGAHGARLSVVHGWWTPVPVPPVGIAITPTDREAFEAETRRSLRDLVDDAVAQAPTPPADVELLPVEQPATQALLERSKDADLLVVGSRGRGGFRALLLGSVSHQVLNHATCAVAVIR